MLFGGPILIERLLNVNLFDIMVLLRPWEMTALDLNLYTHKGCRRNTSVYAQSSVSVRSEEAEDIRTGVGLVPRSGFLSSLTQSAHFLQTTPAYTSNLGYLSQ